MEFIELINTSLGFKKTAWMHAYTCKEYRAFYIHSVRELHDIALDCTVATFGDLCPDNNLAVDFQLKIKYIQKLQNILDKVSTNKMLAKWFQLFVYCLYKWFRSFLEN